MISHSRQSILHLIQKTCATDNHWIDDARFISVSTSHPHHCLREDQVSSWRVIGGLHSFYTEEQRAQDFLFPNYFLPLPPYDYSGLTINDAIALQAEGNGYQEHSFIIKDIVIKKKNMKADIQYLWALKFQIKASYCHACLRLETILA